jgi:hypothetical protein
MPTIIDSLLISVGFKINPEGLEGFAKKTEEAKHMALGLGAALAGAVYGIEHMVHGAVERMGGIQDFSEQMGLSARSVDALGRVARENESSLEAMEGGLRSMTMMAGQAAQGVGRGAMIFKRFGINVKDTNGHVKSTEQLLGDVADRLQKLPSLAQKQALGSRLGFDPATIKLLSEGRANFNKLREEALAALPFKESDYEQAEATEKAFRKAGDAVTQLKERLAIGLLPTVNALLARFKGWASDENNIIKIRDAINKVVEVAGFLVRHLGIIVGVFAVMKAHAYGTMIIGWGSALASMAASAGKGAGMVALLGSGFKALQGVLTGGILGLLILVSEDLYTFHRGGTSVTGWMLTKFPQAVDVMKGALVVLGAAFLGLATSSGPVGLLALGIGGLVIAAMDLKNSWGPVVQWFEEVWTDTLEPIAAVLLPLAEIREGASLIQKAWDPVMTWLGKAWDWWIDKLVGGLEIMEAPLRLAAKVLSISFEGFSGKLKEWQSAKASGTGLTRARYAGMDENWFNRQNNAFNNRTNRGLGALDGGAGNMLTWGSGVVTNNNTVGNVTINIQGSHDPEATGKAAARAVRDVHRVKTRNGQAGAH